MDSLKTSRRHWLSRATAAIAATGLGGYGTTHAAVDARRFGPTEPVGPQGPQGSWKRSPGGLTRWSIRSAGVYENYLIDMEFNEHDAIRIEADGTTLRHCELRNGRKDAIEVYANDVRIENCRIHHFLAGTFKDQADAHGITGRSHRLTIRNCEIAYCSGDAWQMDPGRGDWSDVTLEHCDIWTGPLSDDAAGFHQGEQPGENGVDTKQSLTNQRSRLTIRNCIFHGFSESGYIGMPAALNLKDHVEVQVDNCVFYNNYVALRLRGPGSRGGANVTVKDCYFYDCVTAIRTEDRIENLAIINPRFGRGVQQRYQQVGGTPPGLRVEGEQDAPPLEALLSG